MSATFLEDLVAPVRLDDGDDDLVHTVCNECDRAYCDGGVCIAEDIEDLEGELLCVVCQELEDLLARCPHCGADLKSDTG